jgi:hypothetical protein
MAKNWIVYKTGEAWPDVPEGTRTVVQRDLYAPTKRPDMQVLEPGQDTGYYLPPQGRIIQDSISLTRPGPNGYAPVPIPLLMNWT